MFWPPCGSSRILTPSAANTSPTRLATSTHRGVPYAPVGWALSIARSSARSTATWPLLGRKTGGNGSGAPAVRRGAPRAYRAVSRPVLRPAFVDGLQRGIRVGAVAVGPVGDAGPERAAAHCRRHEV